MSKVSAAYPPDAPPDPPLPESFYTTFRLSNPNRPFIFLAEAAAASPTAAVEAAASGPTGKMGGF